MHLETRALDCLYLNWALPRAAAPPLPPPLRYEIHDWRGEEHVFASALLFRLSALRLRGLAYPRLSYPQMNVRLYVLDDDDQPSVFFRRMLVPFWVAPVSRFVARQPAAAATFSYPSPSRQLDAGRWRWRIRRGRGLDLVGSLASPGIGHGPDLGSWQKTVDYFRQRPRGYAELGARLRAVNTSHPAVEVWPLSVEVEDASLVAKTLGVSDVEHLKEPHSAWLCPQIPFVFELGRPFAVSLPRAGVAATG